MTYIIGFGKNVYQFINLLLSVEYSKESAYIIGMIFSFLAMLDIFMAINIGWNLFGEFMGVIGLLFGGLGIGSFWRPESIGQIAAQIYESMED